ncbi:MAG: 3-dehydroquinate synthase, partial [bacterium]|nr:3-dehydroquinate synthase [bacterium]
FSGIKNCIGGFYAPRAVFWHYAFLETLRPEEIVSGMGEILKTALIAEDNGTFLDELESFIFKIPDFENIHDNVDLASSVPFHNILAKAAIIKIGMVTLDWHEDNLDRPLNLGHSIGNPFTMGGLPHGCAVILGILTAMSHGVSSGSCTLDYFQRITGIAEKLNLSKYLSRLEWEFSHAVE